MKLMIHRNGQNYGPYTFEHANAMLLSGQLNSADLCWPDDASEWVILGSVEGIVNVPPPPPPSTPQGTKRLSREWGPRIKRAFTPTVIVLVSCSFILPLVGAAVLSFLSGSDASPFFSLIAAIANLLMGIGFISQIVGLIIGILRLRKSEIRDQGIALICAFVIALFFDTAFH